MIPRTILISKVYGSEKEYLREYPYGSLELPSLDIRLQETLESEVLRILITIH